MDPIISVVFSLCMYVNESLDGHMMTDGLSKCLKAKREAERNLAVGRENVIRYECGQVKAELRPDAEGNLKIYKIILDIEKTDILLELDYQFYMHYIMKEKKRLKTINRIKDLSVDLDINLFDLIPEYVIKELSPNYQRPSIGFRMVTNTVSNNRNKVAK